MAKVCLVNKCEQSALADHANNSSHAINWGNMTIIAEDAHCMGTKEMVRSMKPYASKMLIPMYQEMIVYFLLIL